MRLSNLPPGVTDADIERQAGALPTVSYVWVFDINRRRYPPPAPGQVYSAGPPIWREHWVKLAVEEETSRSWILSTGQKVPKKGADPRKFLFSAQEVEDAAWVEENRFRILSGLERYVRNGGAKSKHLLQDLERLFKNTEHA